MSIENNPVEKEAMEAYRRGAVSYTHLHVAHSIFNGIFAGAEGE